MIRAPGLLHIRLVFIHRAWCINRKKMFDIRLPSTCRNLVCVLTSFQAPLIYIPRATRIEPSHIGMMTRIPSHTSHTLKVCSGVGGYSNGNLKGCSAYFQRETCLRQIAPVPWYAASCDRTHRSAATPRFSLKNAAAPLYNRIHARSRTPKCAKFGALGLPRSCALATIFSFFLVLGAKKGGENGFV